MWGKMWPNVFPPLVIVVNDRTKEWFYSVQLDDYASLFLSTQLELSEKRELHWENPSTRLTCRKAYGSILYWVNWFGRAQPIINGATPGQVVLGHVRKLAEQVLWSKPVSHVPSWHLLQFLSWVTALMSLCDRVSPENWKMK